MTTTALHEAAAPSTSSVKQDESVPSEPASTTATATAPPYSPIYATAQAQPGSITTMPAPTAPAISGSDGSPLPTATETIATPATRTSTSPPPPQPGARPDPGIPAPTAPPALAASSTPDPAPVPGPGPGPAAPQAQAQPQPTPAATATGATTTGAPASSIPSYGYNPTAGGYTSGFTYPTQDQQFHPRQHPHPQPQPQPNSTSTPYASLYQPPASASQLPLYQNQAHGTDAFDSGLEGGSESGFLTNAKSWIASAGTKLAEVEAEVWRRINEAHDR
ncbi:hypothetical protein IFM61606_04310 [Aspergillus udagawae]|uniref:Uncharacterized protein n=1 Tax=Aspergillus udagawae TaxID=91492 RepID=A0ABQ1BEZ5_9EURO|nr:hypothetical protein IFM53868_10754 [Aspergillus udagawae]GFG07682.1 hypothetical protein IFM5058_03545 [Aspergillus udagawae]GFG24402.1 hypothetical protein IFM61606_04310 [Aspergillus udagawae]